MKWQRPAEIQTSRRLNIARSYPYPPSDCHDGPLDAPYGGISQWAVTSGPASSTAPRVLIVDEIHHLIAGSLNRQREFRNALKSLGNETKVSIVASGIEEAYNAFNADAQMSSRFMPIEMPRWSAGAELGELLMTLEQRTPLREPSDLHMPGLMMAVLARSESMLGDICDLVKAAAVDAIRSGAESITITPARKRGTSMGRTT